MICDNDSIEPRTLAWMATTTHDVVALPRPVQLRVDRQPRRRAHRRRLRRHLEQRHDDRDAGLARAARRAVRAAGRRLGRRQARSIPTGASSTRGWASSRCPCTSSRDVNYDEPDRWLTSTRDAAAVTGACQIVRTEAWRELGGLDERLAVGYNDVDFGMRMCQAGWRVVYTPEVVLGHRESASRGN